jgi:hypothetical protein
MWSIRASSWVAKCIYACYIVAMLAFYQLSDLPPEAIRYDREVDAFVTRGRKTWAIQAKAAMGDTAVGRLCANSPDLTPSTEIERWIATLIGRRDQLLHTLGNTRSADYDPAGAPAVWRLAKGLQAISTGDLDLSQRRFWRFVNEVDRGYRGGTGIPGGVFISISLLPSSSSSGVWGSQQRHIPLRGLVEDDLSLGDIRAILASVVDEIEVLPPAASAVALVARIRQRLFREIERRVGKRAWTATLLLDAGPSSVRDRILAFLVHTGKSPPASAASRPAVGRALSNTAARKVAHETICRRETRTNLSHALCRGTTEARRDQCTRDRQSVGRFAQPARCRGHRSHHSLEECA